ncbi:uncharacterized protein BJ171DRAFT_578157 [Polychytrium aggregatum]|uniref:uncharacterized protein n=1 Tax=Polychytrium aggregatum TaxID=110093 RepID=UPI0022FE34CB|nr:uncharacterized protein BJ171DRAFT_578157 [Polychytrium aggregatum]KAI9208358.1 hypothetical protein BJ171DRAFT_578157 [Polychytrium aggregatum]
MSAGVPVIDVHSHINETPETLGLLPHMRTQETWVMGTHLKDWSQIDEMARQYPSKVIPGFGVHPWFAHTVTAESLGDDAGCTRQLLEDYLRRHPKCLLGEIGLDKIATHPGTRERYDYKHQMRVFEAQFEMASQLGLPVSVHAVRCHGELLQYLQARAKAKRPARSSDRSVLDPGALDQHQHQQQQQQQQPLLWPPAIMLHSWSGSHEITRAILKLPPRISRLFYFSFSHIVNSRSPKWREQIAEIPEDRILAESDLGSTELVDEALDRVCAMIAEARGWSPEETLQRLHRNSSAFWER